MAEIKQLFKELQSVAEEARQGDGGGPVLPTGGQPPYDGEMEARVSKLEEVVTDTRERLARVETKLDQIVHDVGQFKWWAAGSAVAIVLAMIATVLGTGVAIQQMTVSTFQAAGQQSQSAQQQPIIINVPPAPVTAAAPTPAK